MRPLLGAGVPPAWIDSVEFDSGHVAKFLDVIPERSFCVVGQLGKRFERNLACDFQPDESLNLFLSFDDVERYLFRPLRKQCDQERQCAGAFRALVAGAGRVRFGGPALIGRRVLKRHSRS